MRVRNHLVASHASGSGPGEPGGDPLLRANPLTALEQRHGFVCSQNMCLVSVRHFADTSHRQSRIELLGFSKGVGLDRKSTRLNSSHSQISYAVFCLKK